MGKQVMDSTDQAARPGRVGSAAGNSVLDTPSHMLQRSGAGCVWLAELSARAPPRRSLRIGGGDLWVGVVHGEDPFTCCKACSKPPADITLVGWWGDAGGTLRNLRSGSRSSVGREGLALARQ